MRRTAGVAALVLVVSGLSLRADADPDALRFAGISGGAGIEVWDFWPKGGSCGSTQEADADPHAVVANGGWQASVMDASGEVAGVPVGGHSTSTYRYSRDLRGTARIDLRVASNAHLAPGPAEPCSIIYEVGGAVMVHVTTRRRSWLVGRSADKVTGYRATNGGYVGLAVYDAANRRVARADVGGRVTRLVPPDTYRSGLQLTVRLELPAGDGSQLEGSLIGSGSISFIPVGTRRTLTGTGTDLITVGHRDCARNRVAAFFSSAARTRLRSATFVVDGQRRAVLRGRELQHSSLVLDRIARRSAGKVSVRMVLRSGARRVTASTSWPCA
ncbi:hypothetical protein ASE19_03580 [Nocardioides sp. Root79]|nr:hypothetical protein ASE19_03580 [Nocardioides sp. Root79]KRC77106.1 hypothetical protein ASE20_02445 [Nocardioides sp. Root240]